MSVLKKIFTIFITKIIPNSYTKRRHFHHTTIEKDSFLTMSVFCNRTLRKILFEFAKLFAKFKIADSIYYRLYLYQKAPIIQDKTIYNFPLHEIDCGIETRKVLFLSVNETLNFSVKALKNQKIWIGFSFLENYFQNYNVKNYDLEIYISIKNQDKLKNLKFSFPTDFKKHGIAYIDKSKNWIDISVDLNEFAYQDVDISLNFELIDKSFLAFPKNNVIKETENKRLKSNTKGLAISNPVIFCTQKKTERIIYLCCESFTDPFFLEKIKFSKKIKIPNIKSILLDSTYYKKSYSFADSTMPNIISTLSGLSPLQHGFGNYKHDIFNSELNENIKHIPELIKNKNFISTAYTSCGRFDPLFGHSKTFDLWSKVKDAHNYNAPSSNKIINAIKFFEDQNVFLYTHLDRLHGPMLNNLGLESPMMWSGESISEALTYKFNNLYVDRLEILDDEIGKIINYLKSNNLYDETTLIINGDHGASLPPEWKMNELKYPLYETHSRVPLIIKHKKSFDGHQERVIEEPTSSQFESFYQIIKSQNLDLPHYFENLFQSRMKKLKFAVSEVIFHPKHNNYGIALTTEKIKLYKLFNYDWEDSSIKSTEFQRAFMIDKEGIVDENNNMDFNNNNFNEINSEMEKIIIENNIFRKNYRHKNLKETIERIL